MVIEKLKCVSGGETRQDSVYCGVRELKPGADLCLTMGEAWWMIKY